MWWLSWISEKQLIDFRIGTWSELDLRWRDDNIASLEFTGLCRQWQGENILDSDFCPALAGLHVPCTSREPREIHSLGNRNQHPFPRRLRADRTRRCVGG